MSRRWHRRRVLAAGAALAASLAGCSGPLPSGSAGPEDAWPQPRGDATRAGANGATVGPATAGDRWRFEAGGGSGAATPAVIGEDVYAGSEAIYALDAATGERNWRRPTPFGSRSPPAVDGRALYASSGFLCYALEAATGEDRWVRSSDRRRFHAPALTGGRAFVGTTHVRYTTDFDAEVLALDARRGDERWSARAGGHVISPYAPAVAEGTVVVGRDRVTALHADDGSVRWTASLPDVSTYGDPAIVDGTVYLPGVRPTGGVPAGALLALDLADGSVVWRVDTGLSPAPVAVADGIVYAAADRVFALDAATGDERWSRDDNRYLTAAPTATRERVYLAGVDGTVTALRAGDGTTAWRTRTTGSLLSAPAVVGDALYVGSAEGYVFAIGG